MTDGQIKALAEGSYTKGELDPKKVRQIAKLLKPSQLRKYIKQLKRIEEKRVVRLIVPNKAMISPAMINKVKGTFEKKRLVIDEDPELILGVKIIDNDLIYELNLKNNIENISRYIMEQYDR
jgi:F0F1-type ATP synthase delta subunit